MVPFDVLEANDLAQACTLLAKHKKDAKLIAGGQNVIVLLRQPCHCTPYPY